MSADENLWYVKTADGDVHRVSLDQLDDAFQAGRIDGNVMVLAAGSTQWAKLSELAGLDTPDPAPPPVSVHAPISVQVPVSSYAGPNSLRPVSTDLGLADIDEDVFKKKSRTGFVVGAVVGVLAIVGGIFVANRAGGSGDEPAAAAAAPVTAPATPSPVIDPAPPPAAPATTPPADPNANKLTDDQKAKLAAADRALDAKMKAHKKGRAGATRHSSKYKSQGFTSGGSKFDPLNANL